jgi:GT2 family glycosyltransferase
MLAKCLDALTTQCAKGFTYSIVVVDNDAEQSARSAVRERAVSSSVDVVYAREDEPNISRARNKAVASARGEYIAFIDDDEVPGSSWLLNLYETCQKFSADGVLGPVLAYYEKAPPDWLVKSGLCFRGRFPTGTRLNSAKYLRTGNILLQRKLFDGLETPFDPRLGRSGGEDTDFLGRMLKAGRSFVWCEEAPVYEIVPVERQTLNYHLRRALIRGVTKADEEAFFSFGTVKSIFAVVLYAVMLPFLLATRYHLFARYLVKCCDHLAKLLAHLGPKLTRERTF